MTKVGIRELKAKASSILSRVDQEGERYVVTRRGQPLGMIVPLDPVYSKSEPPDLGESPWAELDQLAEELDRKVTSSKTSSQILDEIRR